MSLTRVSPALFQVSNNITSVTVGGSANTVSLTFDSNGVITGASNNALSVANTQITGLIEAAQIGSANATLVTSGTLPAARLPAGSVLQVVSVTFDDVSAITNTSFASMGVSLSITPRSASNKILVMVLGGGVDNGTGGRQYSETIYRGATNLSTNGTGCISVYTSSGSIIVPHSTTFLDSPATTSATTYTIYGKVNTSAVYFNSGATGTLIAMEIAA